MMDQRTIPATVVAELAGVGSFAARRGWVPATSGNFSCRIDASSIAITRSGVDKGALREEDLLAISLDAPIPAGVSAEAPLHVARYRADANVGAVLHVHTVAATVLSQIDREREAILIEGYEMQKALTGFDSHESRVRLRIFHNAQDTPALATRIEGSLGGTLVPGYLLAGHGIYAWGATPLDARRHLEGLEFLLRCVLEERRLQR